MRTDSYSLKRNSDLVLIMLLEAPFDPAVLWRIPDVVQIDLKVKVFFQRDVYIEAQPRVTKIMCRTFPGNRLMVNAVGIRNRQIHIQSFFSPSFFQKKHTSSPLLFFFISTYKKAQNYTFVN